MLASRIDQPILDRLVRPLDVAIGRHRVGTDDLDTAFVGRSAELRHAGSPAALALCAQMTVCLAL